MKLFQFVEPLNRIWEKITGQVTGFFSNSVFGAIQRSGNPIMNGILFSAVSILYMVTDSTLRSFISGISDEYKKNKYWRTVINDWLDNFYRFAIFIIIQEINQLVITPFLSSGQTLLLQVSGLAATVLTVLLVVTIFEGYRKDRIENGVYKEHGEIESFLRAWDGIYGVFISFYTLFFFKTIMKLPNQLMVGIASFVTILSYFVIDESVRLNMNMFLNGTSSDVLLAEWISKILDFGSVFLIFFSLEYIGDAIGVGVSGFAGSLTLQLLVTVTLYMTVYSMFAIVTNLGLKGDVSVQVWVQTIARVWPKISGTTTGIFARIITEEIYDVSNRNLYVIATIATLLLYAAVDYYVRDFVHKMNSVKDHPEWKIVLDELFDFPLALGPLLTINVVMNEYLPSSSNASLVETFAIAIGFQMLVTFIFSLFRLYEMDYKEK